MPYVPPARGETEEYTPITPGPYAGIVEALELRQGPKGPYVAWTFVLAEGEFKNRKVWNNSTLSSAGINMATGWWRSMEAAIGEEDVAEFEQETFDTEEDMVEAAATLVCGRLVTLAIGNRIYDGKNQNDVIGIKEYDGELPQFSTEPVAGATSKAKASGAKRKSEMDF